MLRAVATAFLVLMLGAAHPAPLGAEPACSDEACEDGDCCPLTSSPCPCTCCVHLPAALGTIPGALVLRPPCSRLARNHDREDSPPGPYPREILVVPRAS